MNTNNILSFLLLFNGFLSLNQSFSQEGYSSTLSSVGPIWNNTTMTAHMNELTNRFRNWNGKPIKLSDIRGSMYFDEDFIMGKVYLGDQYYGSYLMRYNAYADEMEAKKTEKHEAEAISKSTRLTFEIGNEKYVLKSFVDNEKNFVEGYLSELISNDKYSLYHKKTKNFKEGKKPETSYHEPVPPQFLTSNTYYIAVGEKNPQRLKNSKKALMEFIPKENHGQVKKFIKENNVSLKEKEHLIKLIDYVNSIN
ncbi:hypothetical protein [Flagellimonas sp. S3867]|uniref:hypothetical protein n=1 Tax=Flagellimonas sp. S3867 TaxID=2768063 RepID=UPI001682A205|nr:hypothetical protein [Flagellimonas sp. S3867]